MKRDRAELDLRLHRLMRAKLGRYFEWSVPNIEDTVGPFDPTRFEKFDTHRRKLVTRCTEWLSELSDEQIVALSEPVEEDEETTSYEWRDLCAREIAELPRREPPWYAGGFGHPDYQADFEYWCKMPSFSVEEVVCLSVGIEPRHFPKKEFEVFRREDFERLWPTLQFLLRRHDQFKRQFDRQGHGLSINPTEFIQWADRVFVPTHPEFLRLLVEFHPIPSNADSQASRRREPDKRETDSIAQLFTAMAIEVYGYDPKASRSTVTKDIADLAASMGIVISDDTVRKYLKLGASFIPEDWKPKNDYSDND